VLLDDAHADEPRTAHAVRRVVRIFLDVAQDDVLLPRVVIEHGVHEDLPVSTTYSGIDAHAAQTSSVAQACIVRPVITAQYWQRVT
jgi:hypothetical protein